MAPTFANALKAALPADVVYLPGSADFPKLTKPWNLRCWPIPAAIVTARNPEDVAAAVKVAAKYGIAVQPRSGGHSFGSYSLGGADGALVIDLAQMNEVVVHPEEDVQALWKAEIGGGTRLQKVTNELYNQGKRAIAHGTCPSVGIGGHATIGGQGPTSRVWGLTLDHVIKAEIVTADGSIKLIDAENDPDLFWAVRGAGASFGIITRFHFKTHPALTDVEYYTFQYTVGPPDALSGAFHAWQTYLLEPETLADRRFNSVCTLGPGSFIVRGSRMAGGGARTKRLPSMLDVHLGKNVDFKKTWTLDWIAHAEQWAQDEVFNFAGGRSAGSYLKGLTVKKDQPLSKETTDKLFQYMHDNSPGEALIWFILADYELGAIADHAEDATPYAHRDALYTFAAYCIDPIPDRTFPASGVAFLNGLVATIRDASPTSTFGAYPGYVDPELPQDQWATQYWGGNYQRLREVKSKYDPKNVFRNPQSVAPLGPPVTAPEKEAEGRHATCGPCLVM